MASGTPPAGFNTLLDVARLDAGAGYPVIDETIAVAPELQEIPADTITGATMELSVLDTLPTIAFRNANEGTARSKAKFSTKLFQTAILEQQVAVDLRGVVAASKDQARFLINQSIPFMKATLNHIAKQFWYGTGNDAKGFPGMLAQYAGDTAHEVDATGAAVKTSVWFLEVGPANLQLLFGEGQSIVMSDGWMEETVLDANDNPFRALTNWVKGRPGLRLANKHAAVRIKNIGIAAGKTMTDALAYAALDKCEEVGMTPNLIFARGRTLEQWRNSRAAYSPTGAPPPRIQEFEGIRIVPTLNLSLAES